MLKILHTGDIHLGAPFQFLGSKAKEHRRQLEKTFLKIIQTALQSRSHALIIAGDLFDSNTPQQRCIDVVHEGLKQLERHNIFAILLPGTHDFLGSSSIYTQEQFEQQHSNVIVFHSPNRQSIVIPEIDTTFHANPLTSNKSTMHPLNGLKPNSETTYNIAVAHGSIAIPGKHAQDDWPITFEEIAQSNMDYVALAHWHTAQDYTQKDTPAWYCGSPEPLEQSQQSVGTAISVEWDPSPNITTIPIGTTQFSQKTITIDQTTTSSDLLRTMLQQQETTQQQYTTVTIKGIRSPQLLINTEELEEQLLEHFHFLTIQDTTTLAITDELLHSFPRESLQGQFIEIMRQKIEAQMDQKKKASLEHTLQIGLAELQGRKIIEP